MTALYSTASDGLQDLFREADEAYSALKLKVQGEWVDLPEPEVERRLFDDGAELLRRMLQSHVTLRGQAKPVGPVIDADGIEHTHVREETGRPIESIFGTVRLERTGYRGRGLFALQPVDADLNLAPGRFSLEVERRVALDAARNSFDATGDIIARTTRAAVAKRQIEDLTRRAALDFDEFYARREFDPDQAVEMGPLMILTFDQKGIVMRKEDLLDATRKIAEGDSRKLQTRHSKGEPHGRKRMATVAAVYTVQPHDRSATEIVNGLRRIHDATPKSKPRPELKRLWASVEQLPQDVIGAAFAEALKRDPHCEKRWIVLIDGDKKLESWVKRAAKDHRVTVTFGLDMIHALQYLWRAGMAFHAEGTPALENWVLERLQKVLEGHVSDVVAGMTRSATLQGLTKKQRTPVDRCARYFLRRKHMMCYDELLKIGAPVATGVVEGGCKYLINDRLDVTGARWSLKGAEAVLCVRALVTSGDFDEYWIFHEANERHRNHSSHYAGQQPPAVALPTARSRRHLRVVNG
jgi:hypothetical protein